MLWETTGRGSTTVGVLGPSSVAAALRERRSAVEAAVAVELLDGPEAAAPDAVDCVVAATRSGAGTVARDGGRVDDDRAATGDGDGDGDSDGLPSRVRAVATREAPPVVYLAPPDAGVTAALEAGVAEYLPRSTLDRAPSTVLRRAVEAADRRRRFERYRTVCDGVAEPAALHDPDTGAVVHANRRLCDLLGRDRSTVVGASIDDYAADVPGRDTAPAAAVAAAAEAGRAGPVTVEWPLATGGGDDGDGDGDRVWVEATLERVEVAGRTLVLSTAREVSDRRRQLEEITGLLHEVVYLARADLSEVLFVNDAYAELFGQPAERVYEEPLAALEAVHPEDRAAYRADLEAMSEHVQSGADEPYEFSHRLRVDGETRWVEVTGYPSRGPGGEVDRVVGLIRDVTERVRREREYEQIFDGVNDAITVHDPETAEMVDANETFAELLGYDRERLLEMEISEFSRDDLGYTTERGRAFIEGIVDEGTADQTEWALETADGETVWVEVHGSVAEIGGERRFVAIDRDVTEAKRREREFEQIFNAVDDPITIHDPETAEHLRVNDGFCDLLGYTREEIKGMSIDDYSVVEEGYTAERAREFVRSVVEGDEPREMEWVVETSEGERRWLRIRGTTAEIGGQLRYVSIDRDITERKRREREYEQIFHGVNDAIAVHDPETGAILDVNDSYVELYGYDRETILEAGMDELSVTEEGYTDERARELVTGVADSGTDETVEWRIETADGERRTIESNLTVAEVGGERRVLSLIRDVTERKRREREYEQIFHGVPDPITIHDPETAEPLAVNDALCEVLGYDRETILERGNEVLTTAAGYDEARIREVIGRVMETGEPETFEWKLRTADGDTRVLEATGKPAEIGGEERYVSLTRDVTERRRRERDYERIFDRAAATITLHAPGDPTLRDVNRTLCDLLGYDRETLVGTDTRAITADVDGYDADRIETVHDRAVEEDDPITLEWPLETRDGETRWIEATVTTATIGGETRVISTGRDITEAKRREREYEQIFHGANDVITIHDPETGEYLDVNDTLCELTGYDRETILEMGIDGVSATEDGYTAERAKAFVERVVETGEPDTVEWKVETADGEHRWLEVNGSVATIGGEKRFVSLDRDITEAKRREREYEQVFHGVNDAIAVFDPETGEILDVNDPYRELLGYDLERIRELGIDGLSVTEEGYTAERGRRLIREVARTGDPETVEWKARRRDGEHLWLEATLATATVGGERRVLSIQRDITERKRREREYEEIFDGVNDAIAVHDPETGEMVDVNATMSDLTGYDRETILDRGAEGLLVDHPEADFPPEAVPTIIDRVMAGEAVDPYEQVLGTADGERLWIEVNPTRAVIGGEERFLAISRDVTERVRREREFEQIFHGVTDVITVYDPETGDLLDVNDTMCDLLGYDRETILELGPEGVSATELGFERETVEEVVREVAATGEPARDVDWALRTASGERLWVEVNATPATINGRRRVLAIARDVTGRRDREERVQVLNRVLRHNLRNDMDAVRAYATAIEDAAGEDRVREHARQVRETADGLLGLSVKARATERLLRDGDARETRPVGAVLESVVGEVREAHERATVHLDGADAGTPVEANVLRLVVRELVENAAEHAGEAPSIEVRATRDDDDDGDGDGGPTVVVADDGPGVPDRVLTPFRAGGETQFRHNHGLGLWLVNWGVRRLGGGVEFERPPDGGTIVRLRLPDREPGD